MEKRKPKSEFAKLPTEDKTLLIIGYIILGLFLVAIILPVIYIILVAMSIGAYAMLRKTTAKYYCAG